MNITLKRTDEQIELVKAMASKDRSVAYEAQQALAAFIGPVLAEVIDNAPTLSNLFSAFQFAADDNPSIPLDLYHDVTDDEYIKVYTSNTAGGLPSSHVTPTHSELKLATYRLESAIDFDKRYASRSRLDVVSKSMSRLAQEIMLQQEAASAALIMGTIGDNEDKCYTQVGTADTLDMDDFNALLTKAKRNNPAWNAGTPERSRGITDLIVSPETVEKLRKLAYNPISTVGNNIAAPDSIRSTLFSQAGMTEFFGISIMEIYELGPNAKYQQVAEKLIDKHDGTAKSKDFALALDRSRESMLRAVAVDAESGTSLSINADDQYVTRQKKIGYYCELEEGRTIINDSVIIGLGI